MSPDAALARVSRPRRHPARRIVQWLVLAAAVALLWPLSLGGLFGAIIVTGHSMEPTLEAGDIALVARTDQAREGDVVVIRPSINPDLRVIHRVVGVDGQELELRGDNNTWNDPFDVVQGDVEGKFVARVPQVGTWISHLTHPLVWASLLLLGAGWWLWPRRVDGDK